MPVDVQRERHARAAQLLGDQPDRKTLAKSENSKTVTEIVETEVRQASTAQQRFETSLDEISFVDWAARPLKDQIVWVKSSEAMRSRTSSATSARERHGPPAPRPLGLGERPFPFARSSVRVTVRSARRIEIRNSNGQILARSQAGGQGNQENEGLSIPATLRYKALRFFSRKDGELLTIGPRQRHIERRVFVEQFPAASLIESTTQNGMGVANGSRRKPAGSHVEEERLQIQGPEPIDPRVAKNGEDVAGKQCPVIAGGFGAKPAVDCRVNHQSRYWSRIELAFGTRRDMRSSRANSASADGRSP